jgi:hydroxypyruvate reductase/glycerate 2-kinase
LATEIFYSALKAVDPYDLIKSQKENILSAYHSNNYTRLRVIGFGKASCQMVKATEDIVWDLIESGIVITKYGHCPSPYKLKKIQFYEAGHPVPDENGFKGTEKIIRLLKDSDENTVVVCLISGGGSALLVSPYEGITLEEKQKVTDLLLKAGASIEELNTIRKHISRVKGGRLAELAYPSKIVSLILSDVIDDKLDVIASGPTSPDTSTFADALKVMEKHSLLNKSPQTVLKLLSRGVKGLIPETPKEEDKIFKKVDNIIIGNNKKALKAAKPTAEQVGFHAEILSSEISGEAKDVGRWLARKAIEAKGKEQRARCLISGGETIVTVKGSGTGGRNMELALAFAMEIEGKDGITFLSAGTDGTDGPTDSAGAIVDGKTVKKATAMGLNPKKYLDNNDSYNFFRKIDGLFITGPTGTNVMDVQIVVIE